MKWSDTAWAGLSTFFKKTLISRVKRPVDIHIVRLLRST